MMTPPHGGLDVAALAVVRVARQLVARENGRPDARQDRDTVPRLLAAPDRVVAGLSDGLFRKLGLRRLQLLKANDVRLSLRQPGQQVGQTAIDVVDVEGRDQHAFGLADIEALGPRAIISGQGLKSLKLMAGEPRRRELARWSQTSAGGRAATPTSRQSMCSGMASS